MAKFKNLRHKLRNEVHWNPFSDKYDADKISQDLEKYMEAGSLDLDDPSALTIVRKGPLFHSIFKMIYDYMKDAIEKTKAHPEHIMKFLIAIGNSEIIKLNKHMDETIRQFNGIRLEEVASIKFDPGNGRPQLNAGGVFEMQVDLLNNLFNYIRYFLNNEQLHNHYDSKKIIDIAGYLYLTSNMYFAAKDSYDRITWEEGIIEEFPKNVLHLEFKNEQYLKLLKVGQHRVERNVSATVVETHTIFSKNPELQIMMNHKRKKAAIREVSVDHRGFVSIQVAKTDDYPVSNDLIEGISSIFSFYPHIDLEPLKELQRLTIHDVILLYSSLLILARALREQLSQNEDANNTELKRFFIRIKKKELLSYLQNVTAFTKSQIESFLSIIENDLYNTDKKRRVNLWARPLVKTREVYFLLLSSLQAPNYLQLIDEWLESVSYSLEDRGAALEKYLKRNIKNDLRGKGEYVVIPDKQKFHASKKEVEEIDLIVSMEKMILIAEIKNIKFPMEARDFHNGYKRLKQGAEQVKRKRDFLLKHSSIFDSELRGFQGKDIHVVVICNYPHFTGMDIDGVSIIDYTALQSYLDKGEIKEMKATFDGGLAVQTEIVEKTKFWSNMDEFYNSFESYVKLPTVVSNLLDMLTIKESRITLEESTVQMLMQVAAFNNTESEEQS
ncbi:hypothetical protein ABER99_20140 [Paenibacillus glucanolyticus]|jgi:hypothetical protein|uniref:NERD domain-containing protein n=1 Tax=Paenibacillus glucanolyticus TaxID=59843 RepID=A0A163GLZ3_9BACL|nr:hypothetical protein [Paenibacillus glucanolyticus]KZS45038.1 hypothetical protein AWU65_03390 [Paenibacillus glucanolyticus]OMF66724.1 hypothetical protein BK142_29325 [Paenibacillus glucanolyticus]